MFWGWRLEGLSLGCVGFGVVEFGVGGVEFGRFGVVGFEFGGVWDWRG